jgi:thymidylate kinase
MKQKVINFVGAPGAGKSTHAAAMFTYLKRKGVNCELVAEYAKGVTWRGAQNILTDQLYVFAKQYNAQFRLKDKVEYIITDSPLILSMYYGANQSRNFKYLVREKWDEFDNINLYITRTKEYNPSGRNQTEEESDQIGKALLEVLKEQRVKYKVIHSDTRVDDIYYYVSPQWQHAYALPGMIPHLTSENEHLNTIKDIHI